ncbi:MAG: alpha-2-macroglobulin [Bacteroidetes bacterium]|nr:alpha-2-macroglobulin [Bacteroidota bacterium]
MTYKFFLTILIAVLFSSSLFSQNNYDRSWKKIDSLINQKGLTQSALEEVNKIYATAKKEKNKAQVVKALIYKLSLQEIKDNNIISSIQQLNKEITATSEPSKSILLSLDAELYWKYFQQHRYQLYDRTQTINFKKDDIATWGAADFHKKISELYLASIQQEKLLQQTKLESFDPILIKGNVRYLRPTLYDLLGHRALDYFKNDEMDVNRPAYAFQLNDPAIFANRNIFSSHRFITKDSLSLHFKALTIFQQLIQFHSADSKPDAMIDVDIERIGFAWQYAVMENKDALYEEALYQLTNEYDGNPIAAQAWFLQAEQYSNKARQYDPLKDTSNRYAYLKAKAICEHVIQQKDSSEGKSNCANLLVQITEKEIATQTEKVNVPGQPFRTLLSYRNFAMVYWRIIMVDKQIEANLGTEKWKDDYWKKLVSLPAVKSYSQLLPDTKDYQKHTVEIKTDALEPGEYILLAGTNKDFNIEKNYLCSQVFSVSNISYISNANDYFVLNRETGQPLQGTEVQVWYQTYDARQNKYVQRKGEQFNTDKNGFFHLTSSKTRSNNEIQLEFKRGNDHLLIANDRIYNYYHSNETVAENKTDFETENLNTFFFSDRSIYRPGQTIFFKGIVVTKDFQSKQYKILPKFKTKVILYNANDEKIDSLFVEANEFGSYHGSFKLPEGQLNGEFTIKDDSTDKGQSFSVEEYKRPKFEVTYNKIKGSYRVNDSIQVTGTAKAYAGNFISNALVKYRVVRNARVPYLYYYKMGGWRPNRQQQIIQGETQTDNNGKFKINFNAIPDNSFPKESDPVFDYEVSADITDINGETHSAATTVHVSYKAINISIDVPEKENLPADSLKYLSITTENLSGEFESTKVNINIYQLASPNRLIRERYWQQPDQFIMTKEEYLKYFPYDEYSDETKKESWQKIDKIFEANDTTKENKKIKVQETSFKPGWYLIEAIAKDKYGEEIRTTKFIQLFDNKTGFPPTPTYNWATYSNQYAQPGEIATVNIGSSAKDLFVIQNSERSPRVNPSQVEGQYHFLTISNEKKSTTFPITESDRGGFGISYAFVKNNRVFTGNNTIMVPWTNKQLSINYESYRDKTLPSSEEKWKIKIAGYKKDKVAAEVLASMYDASLDQFKQQNWTYPDIYTMYASGNNWTAQNNFYYVRSDQKNPSDYSSISYYQNIYDKIFNPREYRRITLPGIKSELQGAVSGVAIQYKRDLENNNMASFGFHTNKVSATAVLDTNKNITKSKKSFQSEVQIRKNFSETAFFFPDLKTDSAGNVEFSFTMPEALTQWKWMTFAHTKDLSMGYDEKMIVTQKQLMVQPNAPRFLREGDKMEFNSKIVNMTDSMINGSVILQLIDPSTNKPVDIRFDNNKSTQNFSVGAKQSVNVNFPITIPYNFNQPIIYRITATAPLSFRRGDGGEVSDGEEATLPVLNNRTLVTESIPLNINGTGTKKFRFEKLLTSGESKTLSNQSLTVEFTSNPAWYAVQSLPYLMEYPYECSEQSFNRFYANALASMIANSSPRIKEIFDRWKINDTTALLSNLQKNEGLKSVLLEETPWVLEAKNESTQKKNIALLFDMVRMNAALESAFAKWQNMQLENGGFSWFKDGPDDRYITQYILTGIGHLKKMNALPPAFTGKIKNMVALAITYLDKKIKSDYDELLIRKKKNPNANELSGIHIQYLYMRSFFSEYAIPGDIFPAMNYYRKQAQKSWLQQSRYMQGMIALALFRTGDIKTANDILASLKQNATVDEEMGMYWKDIRNGYYWYESPIETQSLLIEAFHEIKHDNKITDNLKTWLLKQKQTQNWSTTKATADACYALLSQGTNVLAENPDVQITLGKDIIDSKNEKSEAGTGYFKKIIPAETISAEMGNVTISVSSPPLGGGGRVGASWGAIYWQYFENLDKITPSSNSKMPLTIDKKLFIEKNTDLGPVLEPITENTTLKIGDKIKVRIELRVDRDMEYVHMKDMRASASEPVNVISQYKWQGGLGYYETTKDASTNFFFSWLPEGTHVFEYPLFITSAGDFSNGITTIQCMYAPEFSAHSDGIRVHVK